MGDGSCEALSECVAHKEALAIMQLVGGFRTHGSGYWGELRALTPDPWPCMPPLPFLLGTFCPTLVTGEENHCKISGLYLAFSIGSALLPSDLSAFIDSPDLYREVVPAEAASEPPRNMSEHLVPSQAN